MQALIACVESDDCSYHERNRALWALGHLGDGRATPILRNRLTGASCDHEGDGYCQSELKEAVDKLDDGEFNLPEFLWRGIVDHLS